MPRQLRTGKRRRRQQRQEWDKRDARREAARTRALQSTDRRGEDLEEIADDIAEEMQRTVSDQSSQPELTGQAQMGRVVEYMGRTVRVNSDGKDHICRLRSTTRINSNDSTPLAVGDRVDIQLAPSGEGVITEIHPRGLRLSRASRLHPDIEQVLVANVDQLLLVTSCADPRPKPEFLDRVLIAAAVQSLPAVLCINKIDLDAGTGEPLQEVYQAAGFRVLLTSAETGQGLAELDQLLREKLTVLAGQSGVGKSSLANRLDPSLDLKVGAIISSSRKGRHTTTRAILLPYRDQGYLVDTPGLNLFELWNIDPRELRDYFPEFVARAGDCRFSSCQHLAEPDCAVKAAVEAGTLTAQRYRSYLHIRDTL